MRIVIHAEHIEIEQPEALTSLDAVSHLDVPDLAGALERTGFGELEGDEHLWASIAALRAAARSALEASGAPAADVEAWIAKFDGMIAYAGTQGWVRSGAVRAHLAARPAREA